MSDLRKRARALRRAVREGQHGRRRERRGKDAVLHIRLEADVMERIKEQAETRGLSLSDLVRSVLGERFGGSDGEPAEAAFLADTHAFSAVVLAQPGHCALCDRALASGEAARLAQGPPPPARFLCEACYAERKPRAPTNAGAETPAKEST